MTKGSKSTTKKVKSEEKKMKNERRIQKMVQVVFASNFQIEAWNLLLKEWSGGKYYLHNAEELDMQAGLIALEKLVLKIYKNEYKRDRKDSRALQIVELLKIDDVENIAKIIASSYRSAVKNYENDTVRSFIVGVEQNKQLLNENEEFEEENSTILKEIEEGANLGFKAENGHLQVVLEGVEFLGNQAKKKVKKVKTALKKSEKSFFQAALF